MPTIARKRALNAAEKSLLSEAKTIIHGFLPSAEVWLYGSAARGTHGPDSDYDLLVLTAAELSTREEDRIHDALYDLLLLRGELISAMFYAKDFWRAHPNLPFRREVERDAIAL